MLAAALGMGIIAGHVISLPPPTKTLAPVQIIGLGLPKTGTTATGYALFKLVAQSFMLRRA